MVSHLTKRTTLLCTLALIAVLFWRSLGKLSFTQAEDCWRRFFEPRSDCDALKTKISSALGNTTYDSLYTEIYAKANYTINFDDHLCATQRQLLPLRSTVSCESVFEEWLHVLRHYNAPKRGAAAPREIPPELKNGFTLGGRAGLTYSYYNDILTSSTLVWTTANINHFIKLTASEVFTAFKYGHQSKSLDSAARAFPPRGNGLVVGSLNPWVEAILLHHGASHLTTVEYGRLVIKDDRIDYLSPLAFANGWKSAPQFDFAASYSSLEHSGLGRFGDPIDPYGDLKEVQKVRCVLKTGGLFYLAVPVGRDQVMFNAHRIYGGVRWPMMMAGFKLLGTFHTNGFVDLTSYWSTRGHQMTLILKKL